MIVVDCAPTGETLRLLSFPDVARWWLDKVLPWERRLVSAARPFARTFLDVPLPGDDVFADVQRLVGNLIAMNEILRDREHTSIRLVMNPDRMVIREAQRTFTYLNLYGYLTDAVVVNRVFPEEVDDSYFGAWRERQREKLEAVREGFDPVPLLLARYFPEEVVGGGDARPARRRAVRRASARSGSCTPSSPSGSAPRRPHGAVDPGPLRRPLRARSQQGRAGADRPRGPREANYHPPDRTRQASPGRRPARGRHARGELRR